MYTVITENDVSAWDDVTGELYHFPNKYVDHLKPGTRVVYYKGKIKNRSYRDKRLSDDPHYFGVATIGEVYPDKDSPKKDWFATIIDYKPFTQAVVAKTEFGYHEIIPANKKPNYWRDAVRPITKEVYMAISHGVEIFQPVEVETDLDDTEQTLTSYYEGAERHRFVTTYERNPKLRKQALSIHGTTCFGCGFNFADKYGEHGEGFIHVHHTKPVAENGERRVDVYEELIPLCANCHSMVHRDKRHTLSLEELRSLIQNASGISEHLQTGCLFCDGLADRPIIAHNELAFAIYDAFPVTKGHALVIPKRHVSDYFDLKDEELRACNGLLKLVRTKLLKYDKRITGFNVGVNAGQVAGQSVFHCHIHLIPRREGDMEDPKGGVRGVIPNRQKY